jgi:hypothetical protein
VSRFGVPSWMLRVELTQILVAAGSIGLLVATIHNLLRLVNNRPWYLLVYLGAIPVLSISFAVTVARETEWVYLG